MIGTRSNTRPGAILGFALVILGLLAEPALAAKAALLTAYDAIVTTGGRTTLRVKVERENLFRYDLKGVKIEFVANGAVLGSAVSAGDGYADLVVQAGQTAGDLVVTGRIAAGQSYSAPAQPLLLAIRSPQARIVIIDIDRTICDGSNTDIVLKSASQIRPLPGAVQGMNDIAADATPIYVTARDDYFMRKTKAWLGHWGFPRGPVICSDSIRAQFWDPVPYKTAMIRFLKAQFPNMPAGFGNKNTDADAYHANGLTTYLFDTENDAPYRSFAIVERGWDELRASNRAGRRPELSWATRFR